VVGALGIWAAVVVLSALTSFFQRSPVHSDSWWPLLTIWGFGLGIGLVLLVVRRWAWGAAWTIGTIGGAVAYVGGVIIFVLTYGH
jgi:hypothetical protein